MISPERFHQLELEHGCGYWNVCWEHACPCAITTENKGLKEDIYDSFIQEANEIAEQESIEDLEGCEPYVPMVRCIECGCLVSDDELINGRCFDCDDKLQAELEEVYDNEC